MVKSSIIWNEIPGGMAISCDPQFGGIIDKAIVSGEWFVIFNNPEIHSIDGLKTREAAFEEHERVIQSLSV